LHGFYEISLSIETITCVLFVDTIVSNYHIEAEKSSFPVVKDLPLL